MAFSLIALTLNSDLAISGIQNLSFGRPWCLNFVILGAILSAWGHPAGPWEQQEGHVGVRNQIFSDSVHLRAQVF